MTKVSEESFNAFVNAHARAYPNGFRRVAVSVVQTRWLEDGREVARRGCLGRHPTHVFTFAKTGEKGRILWRRPITSASNNTGFRKARVRAGLPKLRWHDLRHTWATWHAQAGTPAIVLQALGGWKDARMVRTYTHLAAVDLLNYANAIRLPSAALPAGTNSSTSAVVDYPEEEQVPDVIGVDDGIRTHNNRNHKASVRSLRAEKSKTSRARGRPKTAKKHA